MNLVRRENQPFRQVVIAASHSVVRGTGNAVVLHFLSEIFRCLSDVKEYVRSILETAYYYYCVSSRNFRFSFLSETS